MATIGYLAVGGQPTTDFNYCTRIQDFQLFNKLQKEQNQPLVKLAKHGFEKHDCLML